MNCHIYCIKNENTQEIHVGEAWDLITKYKMHRKQNIWIIDSLRHGNKLEFVSLEQCDYTDALKKLKEWRDYFISIGFKIVKFNWLQPGNPTPPVKWWSRILNRP